MHEFIGVLVFFREIPKIKFFLSKIECIVKVFIIWNGVVVERYHETADIYTRT